LNALAAYLASPGGSARATAGARPDRYTIDGYVVFADQHGVPAIAPPWGTLNAIDLLNG
jgi:quinoprotein glucose dehydrogenase